MNMVVAGKSLFGHTGSFQELANATSKQMVKCSLTMLKSVDEVF